MSSDRDWHRAPPVIPPKGPSQIHTEGSDKTQLSVGSWWEMESRGVGFGLQAWTSSYLLSKHCFPCCHILVKKNMTKSRQLHFSHIWQAELKNGPQDSHPRPGWCGSVGWASPKSGCCLDSLSGHVPGLWVHHGLGQRTTHRCFSFT